MSGEDGERPGYRRSGMSGGSGSAAQTRRNPMIRFGAAVGPPPKTCQWPMWGGDGPVPHPDRQRFCGAAVAELGKPYCAAHMKRAHTQRPVANVTVPKERGLINFGSQRLRGHARKGAS